VLRSEYSGAYGQLVEVAHAHHFITRYAHLDKRHVAVGQNVQRGQVLGLLGNSGRSTGPHLHYEVLYKNRHINPEAPLQALWEDRH
jgi:murein DD-endopeptidase MepM/ murein hydrolase activator NlpD